MLFVVQARSSESCHPAYVNHVSDNTSRQVVPVHQIHPSMYGYTLTKRKRDWKIEGKLIQKRKRAMQSRIWKATVVYRHSDFFMT